jgi:hypothetical protein
VSSVRTVVVDHNYPYYPGGSIVPNAGTDPTPPGPVDYVPHTETIKVESLLSVAGIRFMFTSFVDNFNNFSAVGVIIIAMIGVGLAEEAGMIGALIRRIVKVAAVAQERRHRHRSRHDAALYAGADRHLDRVLHPLVCHRHPVGPELGRPRLTLHRTGSGPIGVRG